jgi:hypothetical protein
MTLRTDLAGLPPREQAARMANIAGSLVERIKQTEPDAREGDAAVAAIRAWGSGKRLTGRSFSNLVYDDDEEGVLARLSEADGKPSEPAWNALTTATMYVAWLVYRDTGARMPSDVSEVREDTLDMLQSQLDELA